jgi:hypothetical protein
VFCQERLQGLGPVLMPRSTQKSQCLVSYELTSPVAKKVTYRIFVSSAGAGEICPGAANELEVRNEECVRRVETGTERFFDSTKI